MTPNKRNGVVIQGLDLFDIMQLASKKKNKFVALALQEIEELGLPEDVYVKVRKVILDKFGDFSRSLMRSLLGDIEMPPPYHDKSNL